MDKLNLTPQQLAFMDTFGYLSFPGLLNDKIVAIQNAFEAVWTERGGGMDGKPHSGKMRSVIVPFIDQSEYLSGLLDDPRVNGIFSSLLGDDFNYIGSDGNFYVGDTNWHSDLDWASDAIGTPRLKYYKMAFYLDPLTRSSGALRVIPGSHRFGEPYAEGLEKQVRKSQDVWGISGAEIPAIPLETNPGDVVVFNFATKHSAWGGDNQRRMFTINATAHYQPDDIGYLKGIISGAARFWIESVYGERMLNSASPERMVHLQQSLDNQAHLPEEVRKAKLTMSEPAHG
ncbi:MAG: phytanoyl-CoA dioxygenase family protein [Chloroflexi bacterium]|nr:phytanoyl-CoA dioxygenase family protein [Chloroflexota bacterium]MCC6893911.1 phytanoyl-CoA dioxygenase family protein [Anaerolineae bacterium]